MQQQNLQTALARMLTLLGQEREALVSNDSKTLLDTSVQKIKIAEELETLSKGLSLASASGELRRQAALVRREAKINANIASGRIAMTHAKLSLIANQSSPGYDADGKQSSNTQGGLLNLSA